MSSEAASQRRFPWLRGGFALIPKSQRGRWLLLVAIGIAGGAVEAVAGIFILLLGRLISDPSGRIVAPVVGDVRKLFPAMSDAELLRVLVSIMVVFFVLRGLFTIAQTYLQFRVTMRAGARLAARLLRLYLDVPYEFHLQRNSAEAIRNAYDSADLISRMVWLPAVTAVSDGLLVLGILVVLLVSAPLVTIAAGVGMALLGVGLFRLIQPRIAALGSKQQAMATATLQSLQQSLASVRDIKLLAREQYFEEEFSARRLNLAHAMYSAYTLQALPRSVIEAASLVGVLAFLATVGPTQKGSDLLPILALFAYAVLRMMPAANRILTALSNVRFGESAVANVSRDLELERLERPRLAVGTGPLTFEREICLRDVTYRYPGQDEPAVKEVSARIRRGEYVGLVGPTGGGKSTIMDLLTGLLIPQGGEISVDEVPIHSDLLAWQRRLGVVSQTIYLSDDTLRRNIAFGVNDADVDPDRLARAVNIAQLDEFVASLPLGYDTLMGDRGVRLSGGQRQRVAIARALYHDPEVVLFDEGTSALDNLTESAVVAALQELRGDRTIIAVAHRLTTVRECDRILVVQGGRLVAEGSYDELTGAGLLPDRIH